MQIHISPEDYCSVIYALQAFGLTHAGILFHGSLIGHCMWRWLMLVHAKYRKIEYYEMQRPAYARLLS
jgi:prolipoprotein diacylglyceryltransferase